MSASIRVKSCTVTLDCPDALALAEFYANLLGWEVEYDPADLEWVDVLPPDAEQQFFAIACQQIDHYRAPEWPGGDVPQQLHFDLYVNDLAAASVAAEALGARRHAVQPSESGSFLVLVDPVGHPFCLCQA